MSKISQNLDLRQSQNLVMTPQLQQAIKILQMNNIELDDFIEEELAQNPLLEKDDRENDVSSDTEGEVISEGKDTIKENFDDVWTGNEVENKSQDIDYNSQASVGSGGQRSFEEFDDSFENRMSHEATLNEHLLEQLHLAFSDPRDRIIGAGLIDLLDESGYLREGIDELTERLGCKPERIERLMHKMKNFSPTGVFAKDLQECLALQLDEKNSLDEPMQILLENLDLLATQDIKKLEELCEVNTTYLADMIEEIKELNPKPASDYDHIIVQTAIPDVIMKKLPKSLGGGWRIELNHDTLPKVLINNDYYTNVAQKTKDKKDKKYLDEQLQHANWLVRAMDQRAKTILKVAGQIIEEQEAFFLYGIEFLKPLTLKDIAEKTDMHESTVSRVTNNKYIGTPRGIFELKYFFSTALGSGGDAHSSEAVKAKIKNLIDAETLDNILSDDNIVEELQKENIDIARRTVAKYREAMHIPSSIQRRKLKKNTQ